MSAVRITQTLGGELTPDHMVELVSPSTDGLKLLSYDGKLIQITDELKLGERLYKPSPLPVSTRRALIFPAAADESNSAAGLTDAVSALLRDSVELPVSTRAAVTAFVAGSWIVDVLAPPITLIISGDHAHCLDLITTLRPIVRRGLLVANLSSNTLRSSIMNLRPTLLSNRPDLTRNTFATLSYANESGFVLVAGDGKLANGAGFRVLYVGNNDVPGFEHQPRIWLPPRKQSGTLRTNRVTETHEQVQRAGLMYRLNCWKKYRHTGPPQTDANVSPLRRMLLDCIPESPQLALDLGPFCGAQEQDRRGRMLLDPSRSVVEVLWGPMHQGKSMRVTELSDLMNALLSSRGESEVRSAEQVGKLLDQMGIQRRRDARGRTVPMNRENCQRLHDYALRYGISMPKQRQCLICSAKRKVDDSKVIM